MLDVYKLNIKYQECCDSLIKNENKNIYIDCCENIISENDYLFSFEETSDDASIEEINSFNLMTEEIKYTTSIKIDVYGNNMCLSKERIRGIINVLKKNIDKDSIFRKYYNKFREHIDKNYFLCIVGD